jgi:hypothetical protein
MYTVYIWFWPTLFMYGLLAAAVALTLRLVKHANGDLNSTAPTVNQSFMSDFLMLEPQRPCLNR